MNSTAILLLEYDKIKERLMGYCLSELAKERLARLQPSVDQAAIEGWLEETSEAKAILERSSRVPLQSLEGIEKVTEKFGKGGILHPEDLNLIAGLLEGGARMRRFMTDKDVMAPRVSAYAFSVFPLEELSLEIRRCIQGNRVEDRASSELARIRKKIAVLEDRIKSKLDSILKSSSYRDSIQDSLVSMRGGRYVIPVKAEYKRNIEGNILDTSASGSTVFIEPAGVRKLQEELSLLHIQEEKEEYRILSQLTGMVESYRREISINIETLVHYDFLFAKAKYSKAIGGNMVALNIHKVIRLKGAKHPLIGQSAVPLDFTIGEGYCSLVITGPNTGGKTVALKTIGLLTMMAQSGLHVPAEVGSEIALFSDILVDIGDGQSIEQSLSTFSSHLRNIIRIMEGADPDTLVIMDELGAGTDPGEGMGLAIAVMEQVYRTGATMVATTHYSEIKEFAGSHEGFANGCMEFDIETLKPLYRLKIGQPGQSNAFLIALRLGMDPQVIERAHEITYKEKKEYSRSFIAAPSEAAPVRPVRQEIKPKPDREIKPETDEMAEEKIKMKAGEKAEGRTDEKVSKETQYRIGDCVFISSLNRTGIVCELENNKGELTVMVMKKKMKVNKKRLSLYVSGEELYPDNYDFDIIFETKDNRKKRHLIGRKHVEGVVIELPPEK